MTRLIDADLLRKNMEFICMSIMAGTDPYNAPLTEIDNAPTVEERPHGKWIYHENWYRDGECPWECSECGTCYDYDMNFCGECGAKMEEDEE